MIRLLLLLLLLLLRWKRRKIGVAAIIHDDVLERCCSDKLATNLENEETVADCKLLFEVSMHARVTATKGRCMRRRIYTRRRLGIKK